MIEINIDAPDIADIKARLGQFSKRAHVVRYRAINRTLNSTKTDIAKQVNLRYLINQKTVKESLTTIKATSKNPTAFIKSKGTPIALTNFGDGRAKAVTPMKIRKKLKNGKYSPAIYEARVLRNSSFIGIKRMFYAKGQMLQRPENATREENNNIRNWLRLSLSVPQMIKNETIYSEIKNRSMQNLRQRVEHEIEYELGRLQR
ncbi:phage tail protein [Anaerocolumna sp. AGMB13025]|uniref:phage tail protein n=1 Tax=Anaerocolumna sp. AGMB13025 TaxID=3039116 RepID=UPI00241E09D5|nr:phage tail protein [Anaerocolumna sp. AGMB13025]WFR55360.1 phage tail protein [Anaerocolumna sp. AGMB13025]